MEKEFYDSLQEMSVEDQESSLSFFVRLFDEGMFGRLQEIIEKEAARRRKRDAHGRPKSRGSSVTSSVSHSEDRSQSLSPISEKNKKLKAENEAEVDDVKAPNDSLDVTLKPDVNDEPKDLLNDFLDAGVEPKRQTNGKKGETSVSSSQASSQISVVRQMMDEEDEFHMNSEDDLMICFSIDKLSQLQQSSQPMVQEAQQPQAPVQEETNGMSQEEKPMDAVGQFFTCSGKKIESMNTDVGQRLFNNIDDE